ncbi:MAG: sigma 54-interacting transcriptional regulator [Candidatus Competibacteraceae bacterium]
MAPLFLDEIGDISPAFQAKLLRVIQEGEMERVGSSQTLRVDVRVIAATNRDLEAAVDESLFREDLYYRLNVMPIFMPPLRERQEDIPDLARFLVEKIGKQQGRMLTITDGAIRLLMRHHWPGNVREMENCLERSAIMSANGVIAQDVIELSGLSLRGAGAAPISAPPRIELDAPDLDEREAGHCRAGTGRLECRQGGPAIGHDASPDRLPHSNPRHQDAATFRLRPQPTSMIPDIAR